MLDGNGFNMSTTPQHSLRRRLIRWLVCLCSLSSVQYPASSTQAQAQAQAQAQDTGALASTGPIDITSEGGTTYRDRVATAAGNVLIQTDDASIYADYAEYNLDTKDALLVGNVRIYRLDTVFFAARALYNFDTKAIRALDFDSGRGPYFFGGNNAFSPGANYQYTARDAEFTTHDSSKPDYHLTAKRLRIYPDDRAIYVGSTLYVGTTPVFYFPYLYQSLDSQSGYTVAPGYRSEYGAFLSLGVTFPITDKFTGLVRLDYRTRRGFGAGLEIDWKPRQRRATPPSGANLAPFASDSDPGRAAVVSTDRGSGGAGTVEVAGTRRSADPSVIGGGDYADDDGDGKDGVGRRGYAATGLRLSREVRAHEGAKLITYFTKDDQPDFNHTAIGRAPTTSERYRVALNGTQFYTDELYLKVNGDKLSDRYLLQDFFQSEFTRDPQPDNVAFLTFRKPDYVASVTVRAALNPFFNTTERLPEASFEVPRRPLFGTAIHYESESSAGYLNRAFANNDLLPGFNPDAPTEAPGASSSDRASLLPSYGTYRLDTFHQFMLPQTYFNWLSVVPRLGLRATYYGRSSPANTPAFNLISANEDEIGNLFRLYPNYYRLFPDTVEGTAEQQVIAARRAFNLRGGIFRPVVNTGVEASFKLSRVYHEVGNRALGLDRLQHVVQPYVDVSYIEDFGVGSRRVLPFDRRLPTTQLDPIGFPQITTIDSIDEGFFARFGVRNRFQTRRDALTFNWLEVDTFFQANLNNPYGPTRLSNLFNQVRFRPLPWAALTLDAQFPLFDTATNTSPARANTGTGATILDLLAGNTPNRSIGGFTEINTALNLQATSNLEFQISHRYLDKNPFFQNSSLFQFGAYYRIDPNWAVSFADRYEFADRVLELQSYTLHRDLTSFVASLGVTVRNNSSSTNRGTNDYGVLLNFTLKDVPKVNLPVGFDAQSQENSSGALSGN